MVRTRSGVTPNEFFGSSRNQKRVVFTIGISGSGKSYWSNIAKSVGWKVVNADQIRTEYLSDMKKQGRSVIINGKSVVPDPMDPSHVFAPELRKMFTSPESFYGTFENAVQVVMDITNLTYSRVPLMCQASSCGFQTEALVFVPTDLDVHLSNLKKRNDSQGFDISASPEDRLRILKELRGNFESFCADLKCDPTARLMPLDIPPTFDFTKLKRAIQGLPTLLDQASPEERRILDLLIKNDIFNRIEYVEVRAY